MTQLETERPSPAEARTFEDQALVGLNRVSDQPIHHDTPSGFTPNPQHTEGERADGPAKRTQATELVELAHASWRVGRDTEGSSFAVPLDGPPVARRLTVGFGSLGNELTAMYSRTFGKTPGRSAVNDAIAVLDGEAASAEREPLFVRVGYHGDRVIIDRGTATRPFVVIGPGSVDVTDRSPVIFRRTELTGVLPEPMMDGELSDLARLINVGELDGQVLWAWMVASVLDMPKPILLLRGEQGTGKTRAASVVARIVDPSPAPVRSAPRDVDQWVVGASGCHVSALDNISSVPEWLSDALCRASTGEGLVKRALYTNAGLSVIQLRRPVILTSIDAGALRGDLGERLVMVELERIRPSSRLTDTDLESLFKGLHPRLLGLLYELIAEVLKRLPHVRVIEMPRMADFSKVLAALDEALGWRSLETYLGSLDQVASDVLAGDPLGQAIRRLVVAHGNRWEGSMGDLLRALEPYRLEGGTFPRSAATLGGAVSRLAPALRSSGIQVDQRRSAGARTTTFTLVPERSAVTALTGMTAMTGRGGFSSVQVDQEEEVERHRSGAAGPSQPSQPSQPSLPVTPQGLPHMEVRS